ncbi:MAG: phosphoribosylanthranilate isomerase [Eubacteriales bacterium]|nr:phosphoribosylanthranilate isomerase [Eubacteriales bacterium]
MTKIKICGLFRQEDVAPVNLAYPEYAGFVFCEKSRRNVSPALAAALRKALDVGIATIGVFVNAPVEQIAELYEAGTITVAQLHGGEDAAYIAALRRRVPEMEIWQAFQIRSGYDLVAAAASRADLVLLDGGAGAGKAFDWSLAEKFPRPFILAGGLMPETIPQAIARLHPYAVDVSSGVETEGIKDGIKIRAAVEAARKAKP